MLVRAVIISVDKEGHPDWLYVIPNELISPEKPVA